MSLGVDFGMNTTSFSSQLLRLRLREDLGLREDQGLRTRLRLRLRGTKTEAVTKGCCYYDHHHHHHPKALSCIAASSSRTSSPPCLKSRENEAAAQKPQGGSTQGVEHTPGLAVVLDMFICHSKVHASAGSRDVSGRCSLHPAPGAS